MREREVNLYGTEQRKVGAFTRFVYPLIAASMTWPFSSNPRTTKLPLVETVLGELDHDTSNQTSTCQARFTSLTVGASDD